MKDAQKSVLLKFTTSSGLPVSIGRVGFTTAPVAMIINIWDAPIACDMVTPTGMYSNKIFGTILQREIMANYKRIFLDNYSYFLTIVTYQRNPILIDNIELLRESFRYAKGKFDFDIDAIVVLPDHFHMICTLDDARQYPKIISSIKRYFSQRCPKGHYAHLFQSASRETAGYIPVWQKRFYEHTIRDERDFRLRVEYIHYNPIKHGYAERVSQWEYSSFDKYVALGDYDKEWGEQFDDSIDLE